MADLRFATHHTSSGHVLHIAEAGDPAAAPIVFLHGSGPGASGQSNFRQNIDAFVGAGYRVILPDLVGYGASSKPTGIDYTLQLFTDTLHEALLAHGITHAALVGNSLGGGIALQLTLDHPGFTRALVLMAPGCVAPRESYFTMPGIAKMMSNFGSPDFDLAEQRRLIANLLHPDAHGLITDTLVAERYAVACTQSKDVLARMRTPDLGPRLGEVTRPILVMWGLNDEFCPEAHTRLFLDQCRDVRTITFGRTGHWVQVERAQEFNAYAIEFLDACR